MAQVFAVPVFDLLESFLVKAMKFKPSRPLRYTTRYVYVGAHFFLLPRCHRNQFSYHIRQNLVHKTVNKLLKHYNLYL